MINVAFAFNLGLYRTFIDSGSEDVYIDEGYVPLLRAFRRHPKVKANLFIEGVTSIALAEHAECSRLVREGLSDGQFELGTYTYNHPVLTMLPFEDCLRQWEEGRRIDRELWGAEPVGSMMPEAAWDPSNVEIFRRIGVEWVLLGTRVYFQDRPGDEHHMSRRSFWLHGTGGERVKAVCQDCDHFGEDEPYFYICGAVVQGAEANVRGFNARVDYHLERGGDGMLMAVKNDAEFVYEDALAHKYGRGWEPGKFASYLGESIPELSAEGERNLDEALSGYEQRADVRFVTISQYFDADPPDREIMLRASAKGYREWMEGSEKMGEILREAQTEVRIARAAIKVASALGAKTADAEKELAAAWQTLLHSETSTGRRACAHPGGKASRIVWAMDKAIEAGRRARGAVDLIRRGGA